MNGQRLYTLLFGLAAALLPASASAGPWTRDQGHGYVNLSYGRIATENFYLLDGRVARIAPFEQHGVQLYGELGLINRWLTASFEGQIFRWAQLTGQGATNGLGDLRIGFWTGLVEKPVRLSAAVLFGIPSGDPFPTAGDGATPEQELIARSLPTGDGEADVEVRLSFGHAFGRVRRWPLEHFLILEAGYWGRTSSRDHRGNLLSARFCQSLTYKAEFGTKLPWKFIDRFWFIFRMPGVVSQQLWDPTCLDSQNSSGVGIGIGNGVTFFAYGFEVLGRIYKGFGANIGMDSAFYARYSLSGANLKVGLSLEF